MFTKLHCASLFGIVEVAGALTEMDCVYINRMDDAGVMLLIWAANGGRRGGEAVAGTERRQSP